MLPLCTRLEYKAAMIAKPDSQNPCHVKCTFNPQKILKRIRELDYIEMAELVPDNWRYGEEKQKCCHQTRCSQCRGPVSDILLWIVLLVLGISTWGLSPRQNSRPYGLSMHHCEGTQNLRRRGLDNIRLMLPKESSNYQVTGLGPGRLYVV